MTEQIIKLVFIAHVTFLSVFLFQYSKLKKQRVIEENANITFQHVQNTSTFPINFRAL